MRRWRCCNPDCPARGEHVLDGVIFESLKRTCPHCGAGEQAVAALVDFHFLVKDPKGKIGGKNGMRLRIACNPNATLQSIHGLLGMATAEWGAVTCSRCLKTEEWREAAVRDGQPVIQGLQFELSVPAVSPEVMAVLETL